VTRRFPKKVSRCEPRGQVDDGRLSSGYREKRFDVSVLGQTREGEFKCCQMHTHAHAWNAPCSIACL
jgi:hypothetical protein